jgi:conjugative relaxase-like TrwC/TraI family protein
MRGEAPGEWMGTGADKLGLGGTASGGQLRELLEGRDPSTGEALRSRAVHVTGWDVTFSPPQSVSVLQAAGEPRIAAETMAAHRAALRSAVGYHEAEACWTRRGPNGARRLVGRGSSASSTSTASVASATRSCTPMSSTWAEGRWTTLDGQLCAHLNTASALYTTGSTHTIHLPERGGNEVCDVSRPCV